MHRSKLFRALVIGGGMTAASLVGCGDEATSPSPAADEQTSDTNENSSEETNSENDTTEEPDSNTDTDTEEEADPAQGELAPCFCGDEPQCCEEVDGEAQAAEGFECCWGTSC